MEEYNTPKLPDTIIQVNNGRIGEITPDRVLLNDNYYFSGITGKGEILDFGRRKFSDVFNFARTTPGLTKIAGSKFPDLELL